MKGISYGMQGLARMRQFVLHLLRDAELPRKTVTVMHRDIFKRAGIPWVDGQRMDHLLDTLTMDQLRRLSDELRGDEVEE